ncbi:MAG: hypothetical protein U9Q70_09370 [Chloroflexota bacterium]|nr:hypothetical protein [Chloroflexota bacterium]
MRLAKWAWLMGIMVLVGVRCSGEAIPTGVMAPRSEEAAVVIPTSAPISTLTLPLEQSSPGDVIPIIGFEGSGIVRVGERTPLNVKIWGTYPINELTLEIKISLDSLQVNTPDGLTDQVVIPEDFPQSAEIGRNEVDQAGILHYQVSGLGESMIPNGILLIIPLVPQQAGIGMVEPLEARVTSMDGVLIPVQMASAWLLEIKDSSAAVPIRYPVLSLEKLATDGFLSNIPVIWRRSTAEFTN